MTLTKAIKLVEREYERARKLEYIRNPLAYALYKVWKEADRQPANGDLLVNKIPYVERAQVYAQALDSFGTSAQLVVAIEELSEIQKEIGKALRGQVNLPHLAEEIADATIMLEQIRLIFDINDEVCDMMDAKVERLQQRIREHKHFPDGDCK